MPGTNSIKPLLAAQVSVGRAELPVRAADPSAMVLFGATGDLTKRVVTPAIYNLARTSVLPEHFALIGVTPAEGTAESWRAHLTPR